VVEVGQVIRGKYKLLRLLGDGGMGSVYEAEHVDLGTHVAVKVLHGDLARKAGLIDRFLQEARVSAQIKSPHVVQVTDVERTPEGIAYLVMELLQGEPLSNVQKREKKLPVATASEYTIQILRGLEAAHALGVVHRDLKPDNVFVTFAAGNPVLKLIDFGIAKLKRSEGQTKNLTVAGMLMGTPEYMAPEQAYSADKVDVRADLYAVGVMMYEMLSGKTPVQGEDPRVLVLKVERGEVEPLVNVAPGVPPQVAGFVHRAMAPRPEMRFANATEMRLALEAIVQGKKGTTAPLPGAPGSVAPVPGHIVQPSVVPVQQQASMVPMQGQGPGTVGPNAFADTADARDNKTGTVMGAPVDAGATRPKTSTVAAAPFGSDRPPAMANGPSPYEPTRPPEKRKGSGLIIALAAVATLLGAGAVVTYVMSTSGGSSSGGTPTAFTTTPPPPTTPTTPVTQTTTVTPPTVTATPLKPPPPSVDPTPPKPQPKPDAGGSAQPHQDAGLPGIPGFPPGSSGGTTTADAGTAPAPSQTTYVTPFGTIQYPGPKPPWWPPDQAWPPPWIPQQPQ
jgi:eukaryotic-like serine/threonine-protein kinase